MEGFGEKHNWTKKSIFWELPCWKTNLLRYNLDVMHIEKNFFDNIFDATIDVKGKTKDNVKARMDLLEHYKRPELELRVGPNGKIIKPKANFTFTLEEKRALCERVKELKMPDGYAPHMSNCIDMSNAHYQLGRLCQFGPEGDIYANSQGTCSIQNCGKTYTNTVATLVDENKRQKIELDSQKKVLGDVQAKLTLEQTNSKKQSKKVHKYAKAT